MAHELETQNGVASFASFREPAWHGLGTVFTEEKNTAEMLAAANLNNWNVRLVDVEIPNTLTSDKSYQYVVRTNPTNNNQTDVLGVVGCLNPLAGRGIDKCLKEFWFGNDDLFHDSIVYFCVMRHVIPYS